MEHTKTGKATPSTINGDNPHIIDRPLVVPVKQAPGNPTGEYAKGYKVVKKITDRPKKAEKHRYERRKVREILKLGDWEEQGAAS